MASSHVLSITAALLLVFLLAATPRTESAITCGAVVSALQPCLGYASGKVAGAAPPPACCAGIRSLKSAAATTADRRAACGCLKSLASRVNVGKASGIPGQCGVSVGYAISPSVNCATVS